MALPNIYHLRRVAPVAQKPCFICYKPTTSVLITPDNKDFFYTCDGHLKDPGFASPTVNKEEEDAKKKEEMAAEIEKVKAEYEAKQQAKKKKKSKSDDEKKKDKEEEKKDDKKDEEERDNKIKALETGAATAATKAEEGPRIFTLHRNVYQMRVARIQNAQQAKRTAERLKNPTAFPAVPSGNP